MTYAPVIIPTLNRFTHFKRCIESLENCTGADKTDVYVGLDFPPSQKYEEGWRQIGEYLAIKQADNRFAKLVVFRREHNCGLHGDNSNPGLLTEFALQNYDRYIFSEDDNEFSPNFLEYMNKNLDAYKDNSDVIAVCGYSYPVEWSVSDGATCLQENVSVPMFGIGFWKDKRLAYTDYLSKGLLLKSLTRTVNSGRHHKMIDIAKMQYFIATCQSIFTKRKHNNPYRKSSDFTVRLYLAVENKYVISPVVSKSRNYGFDGSGSCCQQIYEDGGLTAQTYDYAHQPIDTSKTFDFIPDTLHDDETNMIRMNKFDCRSEKQMTKTNRLIWMAENIGPWAARLYSLMLLPVEAVSYLLKRNRK